MKPVIRDWLINVGLALAALMLLAAAFVLNVVGKVAIDDATKTEVPVAQK